MVWLFAIGVLVLLVYSRGFRKIAIGLILLAVVALGVAWAWNSYADRPRVIEELAGVRLGMSPVDVKLAKGAPTNEAAAKPEQLEGQYALVWNFVASYGPTLQIIFYGKESTALTVSIICESNGYTRLFGLGSYSSEQDVIEKLGNPTTTSIAESGLSKLVSFAPYKVAFEVAKGDVTEVCVTQSGSVAYTQEYRGGSAQNR